MDANKQANDFISIVGIREEMENMQAALDELAKLIYSYSVSLKNQGFTDEQVMHLCAEYQRATLGGGK